jgi:hypothetical protein
VSNRSKALLIRSLRRRGQAEQLGQLFVIVINVVMPQERYEGRVQGFVDRGLKAGCIVGFCHDIWRVE